MHKSALSIGGISVLGLILILLNAVSGSLLSRFQLDLTEEGLYTLSQGSKNIVESIEDPITLRFYFSKTEGAKFPAIKLYGQRIVDMLREYERVSNGKILLEIADPRPDSEEEIWAEKYGLTPIPTPAGQAVYLGLAGVNSQGDEQTIPMFNVARQEALEYDITKMIFSLVNVEKMKVAVLSSLPVAGGANQAMPNPMQPSPNSEWVFLSALKQLVELRQLEPSTESIAEDIDVLLLIHPKNLSERTLFAIDQYVMKGGHLLALVDPYSQADQPPPNPSNPIAAVMAPRNSDLSKLLSGWGLEQSGTNVAADINLATQVIAGQARGQQQNFVLWLSLGKESMASDEVITSSLENMLLPWSGYFTPKELEGVTITPILTTSLKATSFKDTDYKFGGGNPQDLLQKYVPGNEELVLAARIQGKLKTNFPKGQPKPEGEEEDESSMSTFSDAIQETREPANIIVVADTDFISDQFAATVQNFFGQKLVSLRNDNLSFLQNAIENLGGNEDLIAIRSRGRFTRPFTKVNEIEQNAEAKWRQEEKVLQAKLESANARLRELQSASGPAESSQQLLSSAMLQEIEKFREDRRETQERLRRVRRNLRQDKEWLGQVLFLLNTFSIPLLLIIGYVLYSRMRTKAGQ